MTLIKLTLLLCSLSGSECHSVDYLIQGTLTQCYFAAPQVAAQHPEYRVERLECLAAG